ncbi:MAG: TIGR03118 family protein [Pirellulales bacterium]
MVGTLVVPAMSSGYVFHNLVSDQSGAADHADPDLVNAWGVAFNPNGFVWVADNHSGKSTLYDGLGNKQSLVVNIPGPAGSTGGGAPTGIVFNDGNDFFVGAGTNPAAFIFAGEDGVISAWNPNEPLPAPSTQAIRKIDNSASNAIYKGLARANNGGQDFLYATDFHNGRIDAFNNAFGPASLSGNFTDPDLPAGFAPFGIQAIDGELYVTYAKQDDEAEDDVAGPGLGFVNVFDLNGVLQERLISQGALNAPWGLAKAPADFGEFSGALLVGNFGDGRINAYDESTGMLLGSLSNAAHTPLSIEGLWGLQFGNGLNNQPTNTLFFAAGPGGEEHGAYGRIDVTPEPGGLVLEVLALVGIGLEDALFRRRSIGSK